MEVCDDRKIEEEGGLLPYQAGARLPKLFSSTLKSEWGFSKLQASSSMRGCWVREGQSERV